MKTIGVVAALCLLVLSCKNETSTNQTNTETSSATAKVETDARLRPTPAALPTLATDLTVTFAGMITFVIPKNGVQRAVVLRAPGHPKAIHFPLCSCPIR